MAAPTYLEEAEREFRRLKGQADKALAQVRPADLFATLDPDGNSIAVLLKHLAGNFHSRWTELLTTDGEKPDRNRDAEFEVEASDAREALLARWEAGWAILFAALTRLTPADIDRTVRIRSEPLTVLQAVNRGLSHCAAHVGQIILLAKHFAGPTWQSISIPRRPR